MINKTLITPRKNQVRQQNIKYENQNTKYANQNTKYANQKFTLFCREAIFVANLRTFLAYFLQAKKYGGVPKRTNIRYVTHITSWASGDANNPDLSEVWTPKGSHKKKLVVFLPFFAEKGGGLGIHDICPFWYATILFGLQKLRQKSA